MHHASCILCNVQWEPARARLGVWQRLGVPHFGRCKYEYGPVVHASGFSVHCAVTVVSKTKRREKGEGEDGDGDGDGGKQKQQTSKIYQVNEATKNK